MSKQQPAAFFSLKRAAEQLGVHEQTLRSWERQGLIRMARLPRSGYRRVPVEEVQRLQAEMVADRQAPGVRLVSPRRDPESLAQAHALAEEVRNALMEADFGVSFDELMQTRRGRMWLS